MTDAAPRVPLLGAEEARAVAEAHGVPSYVVQLNIFRALLGAPEVAKPFNDLITQLIFHGRLDPRLRELAIMRLGWVTGSAYEWTQHWSIAQQFGVAAEDLLAVREGPGDARFGPAERAVLAAVDETVAGGAISAATWEALREALGDDPAVLVELVMVVGAWRYVSSVLRSLAVPLEEGVAPWPPDGRAGPGASPP